MCSVGPLIGQKTENHEKWEKHTVGLGIWRKTCEKWHKHCMTWNMARNTENRGKCEMYTVWHGIWRKKTEKCGKWETQPVGVEYG